MFGRGVVSRLVRQVPSASKVLVLPQPVSSNAKSSTFVRYALIGSAMGIATQSVFKNSVRCDNVEKQAVPVIYQYQICPFCHRVKAYLDFLGVDYEVVEVNPLTKSEISFSKEHKKVPIAVIDGNTLTESGVIVKYLTDHFSNTAKLPEGFFPEDSDKWMEWSEKRLAVMLYPNITRSFEESWECFGYSDNVASWSPIMRMMVRTAGPTAMFFANGKIKKKYNIVDERKELKEVLTEWTDALNGKKFLHGDQVSLPDLMVYGVLRAIRNFQTFREIMQDNATLKTWFDNVDSVAASHEVCKI